MLLTHSRGRVVVRGRASGGGCHRPFVGGPNQSGSLLQQRLPLCLLLRPGLQGPLACGRGPQSLPLSSHGHPPPGLSCRIRRRAGFPAHLDRPARSHLQTREGLHLQTPASDSLPSRLPARVRFQGALLLPPRRLLLFSCEHPGDRCWRGQPAPSADTEVSNGARRSSRSSREGTWQDAPAKRAAGKGQALHTNALNLCFKFKCCIPCSRALS